MGSIRVMLVDDEYLTIKLLQTVIPWKKYDMEISAAFVLVDEALAYLEKDVPDIIISDINMPRINGIEFGKTVRKKYLQVHFILLTGYDDFIYLQESVRMGATDYILKPINPEEIEAVAGKLQKACYQERVEEKQFEILRNQAQAFNRYYRENLFQRALLEDLDEEEIKETEAESLFHKRGVLCLIGTNNTGFSKQLLAVLQETFSDDTKVFPFLDAVGNVAVVFSEEATEEQEKLQTLLHDQSEVTAVEYSEQLQFVRELGSAYKKLLNKVQYAQFFSTVRISDYRFDTSEEETVRILNIAVRGGDKETLENQIDRYLDGLFRSTQDVSTIRAKTIWLFFQVTKELQEMDALFFFDLLSELSSDFSETGQTPVSFRDKVKNCFERLRCEIRHMREDGTAHLAKEIKYYIHRNYHDYQLTLKSIAGHFYRNPSYLSRIFKQETGSSLIEYITRIRMEEAQLLLRNTDLKNYEVAEKVGIMDANYFAVCFRKFCGITPGKYRQLQKGQKNSTE